MGGKVLGNFEEGESVCVWSRVQAKQHPIHPYPCQTTGGEYGVHDGGKEKVHNDDDWRPRDRGRKRSGLASPLSMADPSSNHSGRQDAFKPPSPAISTFAGRQAGRHVGRSVAAGR